ncbi:MAG: hypothetical protein MR374_04080 [Clostridia bacterium]|nr:hypothetical protein [Clostridia bacterium]MDY5558718.1 Rnf-Nqr domain containing protein [Candidatus Heritagella sp.]
MTQIMTCLFTALAAFTTENLLFSGGVGLSRMMRVARRGKKAGVFAGLLTVFSLLSYLTAWGIWQLLPARSMFSAWLTLCYAGSCALWYVAGMFLLSAAAPKIFRVVDQLMASAAINTVVMILPFVSMLRKWTIWQGLIYCLGTGAAFYLAIKIMTPLMPKLYDKKIPRALRGLPAALLLLGLVALGMMGFTGDTLFFR